MLLEVRTLLRAAALLACACLVAVVWCRPAAAFPPAVDEASAPDAPADIHALAAGLRDAPGALKVEFAYAVLEEMVAAYREEAERARAEVRGLGAERDTLRWSKAVDSLAAEMQRLAARLTADTPVYISARYTDTVYLVVDGVPVLLSGARSAGKTELERRVVERFCRRNDCGDLVEDRLEPAAMPDAPRRPPLWRFSDATGPVCASGDGLELQFSSLADLGRKRELCNRIVAELNSLIGALKREIAGGVQVDWNRLSIRPAAGDDLHYVYLSDSGAYLLLSLPELAGSPALFRLVLPWLEARVTGRTYNQVVLNVERLLGLPVQADE